MKRIIYGGSFDPVHCGHVRLVSHLQSIFPGVGIILVPARQAAHKIGSKPIDGRHRLAMIHLAFEGFGNLEVSRCEMDRDGVSYSIDTIRSLKESDPGLKLSRPGFVVGDDLLDGFRTWREPEALMREVQLIVARRLPEAPVRVLDDAVYLDNEIWDVSSSEIRKALQQGESVADWLPANVVNYIGKNGLYR